MDNVFFAAVDMTTMALYHGEAYVEQHDDGKVMYAIPEFCMNSFTVDKLELDKPLHAGDFVYTLSRSVATAATVLQRELANTRDNSADMQRLLTVDLPRLTARKLGTFTDTTLATDLAALDLSALATGVITRQAITEAEHALADFVNTDNPGKSVQAVLVKSGTQALELALRAIGVRPGDRVATSPWTFIATCSAITAVGGEPVFTDVDPQRWTMDPKRLQRLLVNEYGNTVKAIVPVDLFGVPADLAAIAEVADCTPVVVDACQSLGAAVHGVRVGALAGATATAVSLYPTKPVGSHGEGGAVLTADPALAARIRQLADHGAPVDVDPKQCTTPGVNGRPDALHAALFTARLPRAEADLTARRQLLQVYVDELKDKVVFQQVPADVYPAVHMVQVVSRNAKLTKALRKRIAVNDLYTRTVSANPLYATCKCTVADALARLTIGLPAFPDMNVYELRMALREAVSESEQG